MSSTIRVETITIGDELLLGIRENAHLTYLGTQLSHHGVEPAANLVIRDNPEDIRAFFFDSWKRSDLIITTGGLGPTTDDITRESIAEAFGEKLVFDPTIELALKERFSQLGRPMPENNLRQCYRPENAEVLQNPFGTAPGLLLQKNGKMLVMLPGPAREMHPMFEQVVVPRLQKEGVFPEISRQLVNDGAELLVNMTNDAWYGFSSAPWQHLYMYRLRSVETGRPFVRATNTGITAWIDPHGFVHKTTNLYEDALVIDEADVLSRSSKAEIEARLQSFGEERVDARLITLRRLDYGLSLEAFGNELLSSWSDRGQAPLLLLMIETKSKSAALVGDPVLKERLPQSLLTSTARSTMAAPLREGDRYRKSCIDGLNRLFTVLQGGEDPGPPRDSERTTVPTNIPTQEQTESSNATTWVVVLLAAGTIIPMATWWVFSR